MHIANDECSLLKSVKSVEIYLAVFSGRKILIYRTQRNGLREQISWKLPGYYSDICGIDNGYIDAIISKADEALMKNVCMNLGSTNNYELVPVWIQEKDLKELSFIITIPCDTLKISPAPGVYFSSFNEGVVKKMIGFFSEEEIQNLEIDAKSKIIITKAFGCYKT